MIESLHVDQSLRLKKATRLHFGYASVFRRNGECGEISLVHPSINLDPEPENMRSSWCFIFKQRGSVAMASQCRKIRGIDDGEYVGRSYTNNKTQRK
jgi:hypothetical protein